MRATARQGPLPFWIHQVVEYAIAAVVASSGARLPNPALPLVAAGVIVVLAATADGPVAAIHLVHRGAHRVLDCAVGAGLVVASALLFRRVGSSPAILTGLGGIAILGLSWRTNYAPKPIKVRRVSRLRRPLRTSVSHVSPPATNTAESPGQSSGQVPASARISRGARAEQVGRKAGRYAAVGVKVWRNRKS
jgi:hypothetical protein